jgi:hypothetical protein
MNVRQCIYYVWEPELRKLPWLYINKQAMVLVEEETSLTKEIREPTAPEIAANSKAEPRVQDQ